MSSSGPAPRVLYLGPFEGRRDEGMRKIALTVADLAERRWPVMRLHARDALRPRALARARAFGPNIIHYLAGPTVRSLALLRLYRVAVGGARTLASAVRPHFGRLRPAYLPLLRPDLTLTQDPRWEAVFRDAGFATQVVWNGVDTTRFTPPDAERRVRCRRAIGVADGACVALHVGHLKVNRNLDPLIDIQRAGTMQVVVVGSASTERDAGIAERLRAAGCTVIDGFIDAIEDVYAAADVYVFPVLPPRTLDSAYGEVGVIDTPLSVLEALATGLPVVSTRMPALVRLLKDDCGVTWFDGTGAGAVSALRSRPAANLPGRARAQELDSERILDAFGAAYGRLLSTRSGG